MSAAARAFDPARRTLVLVPHEPTLDPRVMWVTDLCRSLGRTDVLGSTFSTELQAREFDGLVYTERVNIGESASPRTLRRAARRAAWSYWRPMQNYIATEGRPVEASLRRRAEIELGALIRHLANSASYDLLTEALYRRARALSVPPRLIVCHDIFALAAGVRLKGLFGSRLLYDSHEFWPEADLIGRPWQARLVQREEARLIRQADVVVTVTPPLARHLEELYGIANVLSVPNATPFEPAATGTPRPRRRDRFRFLVQGRAAPRRGFDELLTAWRSVDDPRAVLQLRCPKDPYLGVLMERYSDLISSGRVEVLDPVGENELVAAATAADVGIITYPAGSIEHRYACPNKLSQYMHAGLAVLANDLPFVNGVVERADCGDRFDIDDPASLVAAVRRFVDNPGRLREMKRNAHAAGRSWFNWEVQSIPYGEALEQLFVAEKGVA